MSGMDRAGVLRPLDKTIDHLLLAGLLERDGELVAVDLHHLAVAEFLVEHAVGQKVRSKLSLRCVGARRKFDERDHIGLNVVRHFWIGL
jgi:hypothetical protein